ncbi:MAG: hypothetical protein MK212_17940 [Saprospiraceae bacterium]|nr:hypothetical protein [Saprospiraceae bacterium]
MLLLSFLVFNDSFAQKDGKKKKKPLAGFMKVIGGGDGGGASLSEDPNYYMTSAKAGYLVSSSDRLVDGFLVRQNEKYEDRLEIIIAKGRNKGKSYCTRCSGPVIDKELSDVYGGNVYLEHSMSFENAAGEVIKPYQKDRSCISSTRILELEKGVYVFYGGKCNWGIGGDKYTPFIDDFQNLEMVVFAQTEAKLTEWSGAKAKAVVVEFEGKVKAAADKAVAAEIASVRVPAKGKMHAGSFFTKCEGLTKALCKKDNTEFKTLNVVSDDWTIVKHKVTGEILYRICKGYFVDYNSEMDWCIIHAISFKENYKGGSYGDTFIAGVRQEAGVGPIIDCNNAK